ncbi:hypothetical protein BN131_3663 [Cronobacter malonaticus 681]|nr:hypothetical protein BN131_3663 [Cronobacter malonaticus 681]
MLIVRDVIRFGGGEQQFVDHRGKETAEQRALAVMKALHQLRQRKAHIVKRLRPAVERLKAIHQHYLAVETHKMLPVKTFNHLFAVVLVALAQHADIGLFARLRQFCLANFIHTWPREELQHRRARQIARQHKTPRLDKVQPFAFTLHQVVGPGFRYLRQTLFIARRQRIQPFAQAPPALRPDGPVALQQARHLPRPGEIVLRQHGQVEQPFTGVIDNIEIERGGIFKMAQQRFSRAIAQRETDLTHAARRRRPRGRRTEKLRQPFVIGKTRDAHILLRHAAHAEQPFFAHRRKERQPRPAVNR